MFQPELQLSPALSHHTDWTTTVTASFPKTGQYPNFLRAPKREFHPPDNRKQFYENDVPFSKIGVCSFWSFGDKCLCLFNDGWLQVVDGLGKENKCRSFIKDQP